MRVRVNRCSFSWACITLGKFKASTCIHCYSPWPFTLLLVLYIYTHWHIYKTIDIYWNRRARHALTCCSILHLTPAKQTPSDIFKSSWTKCRKPQFNGFVSNVLALMIETTKVSTYFSLSLSIHINIGICMHIFICLLLWSQLHE